MEVPKNPDEKEQNKTKQNKTSKQTTANETSKFVRFKLSPLPPFVSKMSVSTNQFHFFIVCHIVNVLFTELSRSLWKNLDIGRV